MDGICSSCLVSVPDAWILSSLFHSFLALLKPLSPDVFLQLNMEVSFFLSLWKILAANASFKCRIKCREMRQTDRKKCILFEILISRVLVDSPASAFPFCLRRCTRSGRAPRWGWWSWPWPGCPSPRGTSSGPSRSGNSAQDGSPPHCMEIKTEFHVILYSSAVWAISSLVLHLGFTLGAIR